MKSIRNSLAIAAGATVENLLTGSAFEFAMADGLAEFAALGSAVGLLLTITSGEDIVFEESAVDVVRIANQGPIYPDDYIINDEVLQQDRLKMKIRNPTGGAITIFYAVRIT